MDEFFSIPEMFEEECNIAVFLSVAEQACKNGSCAPEELAGTLDFSRGNIDSSLDILEKAKFIEKENSGYRPLVRRFSINVYPYHGEAALHVRRSGAMLDTVQSIKTPVQTMKKDYEEQLSPRKPDKPNSKFFKYAEMLKELGCVGILIADKPGTSYPFSRRYQAVQNSRAAQKIADAGIFIPENFCTDSYNLLFEDGFKIPMEVGRIHFGYLGGVFEASMFSSSYGMGGSHAYSAGWTPGAIPYDKDEFFQEIESHRIGLNAEGRKLNFTSKPDTLTTVQVNQPALS